jgi:hypothetical protein
MKHQAALLILGFLFALLSCSPPARPEKEKSLPADSVIPEKKMTSLLVDVHLLEGALMVQRNRGEQDGKWNKEAYRKLFLRYHVTSSQFVRNLGYYQQNPAKFSKIYDTVIQRINRLKKFPDKGQS